MRPVWAVVVVADPWHSEHDRGGAMARIVVLCGGFAGLWSAVGAARVVDEVGASPDQVEVVLVNRDAFHGIRVRNYERDLRDVRVPLARVLDPIGVRVIEGEVVGVDVRARTVVVAT